MTLRHIVTKFRGTCSGICKNKISVGEYVIWDPDSREIWHSGCRTAGVNPALDQESAEGVREVERYQANLKFFGEEYAAAEERIWEGRLGYD